MWAPGSPGQQVNSQRVRVLFSLPAGRDSELTFMLIFMLHGICRNPQPSSQLSFAGCFPSICLCCCQLFFYFELICFPFFITLQCQDIFWLSEFMRHRCYSDRSCLCFSPSSFIVFLFCTKTVPLYQETLCWSVSLVKMTTVLVISQKADEVFFELRGSKRFFKPTYSAACPKNAY